jgi:hypothetical protein
VVWHFAILRLNNEPAWMPEARKQAGKQESLVVTIACQKSKRVSRRLYPLHVEGITPKGHMISNPLIERFNFAVEVMARNVAADLERGLPDSFIEDTLTTEPYHGVYRFPGSRLPIRERIME